MGPRSNSSKAYVVLNRAARNLRQPSDFRGPRETAGAGAARALVTELRRPRPSVTVVETKTLGDLEDFALELAGSSESASLPVVIFAGGDGSYMAGMSALGRAFAQRPLPQVAFAPGGTVCTVAKNWGMRGDPVAYACRLLDAIGTGDAIPVPRPTLRVRSGSDERLGFIVGTGLVARFIDVYEKQGAGGNVAAARIVARVFGGSLVGARFARSILEPMPCELVVDGTSAPFDRVSLACASVVPNLGLGMRLLYRAGEETERFHVVATPLPPPLLGPQMPLVLAGHPLLGPRVDTLARSLSMTFPRGTGAFVLDGDLVQADAVDVRSGPTFDLLTLRDGSTASP